MAAAEDSAAAVPGGRRRRPRSRVATEDERSAKKRAATDGAVVPDAETVPEAAQQESAKADEERDAAAGAGKDEEEDNLDEDDEEEDDIEREIEVLQAKVDDPSSDDSEDDAPRNRIGNVPLEWYADEDHVGYDLSGERIMRTLKEGEIDALLESKDNPNAWRTIKDHKNQREIVLTDTDLEVIRRIRQRMYPSKATETMEMVEFENKEAAIHPLRGAHPPKASFVPSKWERMKVKKLVALLREGKIRPPPPPPPEVWDLWADEAPRRRKAPRALPAPKLPLPGHVESYNPPAEYLWSEEEKKEWEEQDEQDRTVSHVPHKFDALRRVPAYKELITERFKRCLDLYLVPRALRQRMNVDPESLLPKLPSPKDLRPFPTHVAVSYEGHTGMVLGVAVDPTGQWLATVSADETLRIWEVASGRPFGSIRFSTAATAVAWNPKHRILSVAADEAIFFVEPQGLEPPQEAAGAAAPSAEEKAAEPLGAAAGPDGATKAAAAAGAGGSPSLVLREVPGAAAQNVENEGSKARRVRWKAVPGDSPLYAAGCRLTISTDNDVRQLVWHVKGNYCAAVSPKALAPSNMCIIHAIGQQKSMRPFHKLKGGQVQSCAFHPTKPHFFVASKTSVRIYDLQKQEQLKQLVSGAKWISSISMHPGGDNVVVGSYDRRMVWFDLDFASKPFKTLQYHDKAVRRAAFHPGKFPLMAACSDDATISILHAKVFSDLMMNPMIVPVKRLREHCICANFGVLDCTWHPLQPWLFSAGADRCVYLWV